MQGLSVGDKIVDVNGKDFRNVTHAEAVSAMRNAWNVIMIVEPAGPNTDVTNDSRESHSLHQQAVSVSRR